MRVLLKNIIILVLTIGWLLPIGFGFAFIDEWVHLEVYPIIYGDTQKHLNSFPSYQAGKQLLIVGFCWFVGAVSVWGLYAVYRCSRSSGDTKHNPS